MTPRLLLTRGLLVTLLAVLASGCLVLSVNPAYDDNTLAWDPDLIGQWDDAEDKASIAHRTRRVALVQAPLPAPDRDRRADRVPDDRRQRALSRRHAGARPGSRVVPDPGSRRHPRPPRQGGTGDTLELTPLSYRLVRRSLAVRQADRRPCGVARPERECSSHDTGRPVPRLAAAPAGRRSDVRRRRDVHAAAGAMNHRAH